MKQTLVKKIKKMNGTFLGIGIESPKLIETIKNTNLDEIMFLEGPDYLSNKIKPKKQRKKLFKKHSINGEEIKKSYFERLFEFHGKEMANLKKLRKSFKKKSIDNIVVNYFYIKKFEKYFVKDCVYLNRGFTYIYGNKDDISDLVYKYKRYTTKIEELESDKEFLLIIDNRNAKNNKIKDTFYFIGDTFSNVANVIADILIG